MAEKILMKGNEAIGEAAVVAGCRHYFGYPITPQSELIEYMAKRMPQVNGVFVQAESEISAINMVYGASAAGCRVMTSSSSPGISLKQEGISYIAGSQLPCVIVNMQLKLMPRLFLDATMLKVKLSSMHHYHWHVHHHLRLA